jgi:hypothetical protein
LLGIQFICSVGETIIQFQLRELGGLPHVTVTELARFRAWSSSEIWTDQGFDDGGDNCLHGCCKGEYRLVVALYKKQRDSAPTDKPCVFRCLGLDEGDLFLIGQHLQLLTPRDDRERRLIELRLREAYLPRIKTLGSSTSRRRPTSRLSVAAST